MLSQIWSDEQVNPWEVSLLLGYLKEKENNRKDACIFKVTPKTIIISTSSRFNCTLCSTRGVLVGFVHQPNPDERGFNTPPILKRLHELGMVKGLACPWCRHLMLHSPAWAELTTSVSWSTMSGQVVFQLEMNYNKSSSHFKVKCRLNKEEKRLMRS